jgi:diguanylate cyclase (GGDEF)-like protein/PAS domain S-box-containing protein
VKRDDPGKLDGRAEACLDAMVQIIDHSPDAICIHQDGQFVFFNAVAVRWLGADSRSELIGHAVSRFIHARSLQPMLAAAAGLRRPGNASAAVRTTVVRLDGSESQVEAVTTMTTWKGATAYQMVLRDLTEQRAVHDTLAHQAALVDHAGDAIISVTRAGMVTSWNPAAEAIYRRPARRALALPLDVVVGAPVDIAEIADAGGVLHTTHYAADGSVLYIRISATEFEDGHVLVCSDETAHRRAARNLRAVVNSLQEGVLVLDQNGWLLTINPAAKNILGIGPDESTCYDDLRDLAVYDADGALLGKEERPIARTFATGLPTIGRTFGMDLPNGRRVWLSASCQLLHPDSREFSPVLVTFSDVTSQRVATETLAHKAAHDALTGLPNRPHIIETINALHRDSGSLSAVLFIDLDDLKTVNDTLGHAVGDTVLQVTASRLCQAVRRNDIVGRLAGDEFVALLVGDREGKALDGFVTRIRRVLTDPIDVPGGKLRLGASIGVIQTHAGDTRDAATLLRDADLAMYAAKATSRQLSDFSAQVDASA